jgi:hypothetical protein
LTGFPWNVSVPCWYAISWLISCLGKIVKTIEAMLPSTPPPSESQDAEHPAASQDNKHPAAALQETGPDGDGDAEDEQPDSPAPLEKLLKLPTTLVKAMKRLKDQAKTKETGKGKAKKKSDKEMADKETSEDEGLESKDRSDEEQEPIFQRTCSQSKSVSVKGKEKAEEPEQQESNTMQLVRRHVKSGICQGTLYFNLQKPICDCNDRATPATACDPESHSSQTLSHYRAPFG